jgi:hypothetical protein
MCNGTSNERSLEALWRVLKARSSRITRQLGELQPSGDEHQLWAAFEAMLPGDRGNSTLALNMSGKPVGLTRPELILLGSTAAIALGLADQVLGEMPLGLASLSVGDALSILDPQNLDERMEQLHYVGGNGRLFEAGILAVGEHDAEADAGSVLMADVVLTGKGLRALLAAF